MALHGERLLQPQHSLFPRRLTAHCVNSSKQCPKRCPCGFKRCLFQNIMFTDTRKQVDTGSAQSSGGNDEMRKSIARVLAEIGQVKAQVQCAEIAPHCNPCIHAGIQVEQRAQSCLGVDADHAGFGRPLCWTLRMPTTRRLYILLNNFCSASVPSLSMFTPEKVQLNCFMDDLDAALFPPKAELLTRQPSVFTRAARLAGSKDGGPCK
eukprot:1034636-Amphidinium_carterae.1